MKILKIQLFKKFIMNKYIKSLTIGLIFFTAIPVSAFDRKKAKNYFWQALKIGLGSYIINHTLRHFFHTIGNDTITNDELKKNQKIFARSSDSTISTFLKDVDISENYQRIIAQYISPDKWDEKTMQDLQKAKYNLGIVRAASTWTDLGLIIGIKGIYDEYKKLNSEPEITNNNALETNA